MPGPAVGFAEILTDEAKEKEAGAINAPTSPREKYHLLIVAQGSKGFANGDAVSFTHTSSTVNCDGSIVANA